MSSSISTRANFDVIRYAQLWEDGDVLTQALGDRAGSTLVSICAAGDNALAMLTLDPKKVVVLDLSQAQIECLNLRIGAYRALDHSAFLELMGSRPSRRRGALLDQCLLELKDETCRFWQARRDEVIAHGAGGCGKFERYFRLFRSSVLPLVHGRKTVAAIFEPKTLAEREAFYHRTWNSWRWRMMVRFFFSRFMMGRLGRDKAFFDYVDGSPADHVLGRVRHAAVDTDPSTNPYLHWILYATHGESLPMAWRAAHFEQIRDRLDRLDIRHGSLEAFVGTGEKADGFNLSDIFEYMAPEVFETVYGSILKASNAEARLVYWNMMAKRRVPPRHAANITTQTALETQGKAADKAFFYSDFVVEDVKP